MSSSDHAIETTHETDETAPEEESRRRLRGPAIENLADLRKQVRRLCWEAMNRDEASAIPVERLKAALTGMTVLHAILLDERRHVREDARSEAARTRRAERDERERRNPYAPDPNRPTNYIPARFIVPKQ
jgi:hypothetical protein